MRESRIAAAAAHLRLYASRTAFYLYMLRFVLLVFHRFFLLKSGKKDADAMMKHSLVLLMLKINLISR